MSKSYKIATDLATVVPEGPERWWEPRLRPRGLVAAELQKFSPRETEVDPAQNQVAEVAMGKAPYQPRCHRDVFGLRLAFVGFLSSGSGVHVEFTCTVNHTLLSNSRVIVELHYLEKVVASASHSNKNYDETTSRVTTNGNKRGYEAKKLTRHRQP